MYTHLSNGWALQTSSKCYVMLLSRHPVCPFLHNVSNCFVKGTSGYFTLVGDFRIHGMDNGNIASAVYLVNEVWFLKILHSVLQWLNYNRTITQIYHEILMSILLKETCSFWLFWFFHERINFVSYLVLPQFLVALLCILVLATSF